MEHLMHFHLMVRGGHPAKILPKKTRQTQFTEPFTDNEIKTGNYILLAMANKKDKTQPIFQTAVFQMNLYFLTSNQLSTNRKLN